MTGSLGRLKEHPPWRLLVQGLAHGGLGNGSVPPVCTAKGRRTETGSLAEQGPLLLRGQGQHWCLLPWARGLDLSVPVTLSPAVVMGHTHTPRAGAAQLWGCLRPAAFSAHTGDRAEPPAGPTASVLASTSPIPGPVMPGRLRGLPRAGKRAMRAAQGWGGSPPRPLPAWGVQASG